MLTKKIAISASIAMKNIKTLPLKTGLSVTNVIYGRVKNALAVKAHPEAFSAIFVLINFI